MNIYKGAAKLSSVPRTIADSMATALWVGGPAEVTGEWSMPFQTQLPGGFPWWKGIVHTKWIEASPAMNARHGSLATRAISASCVLGADRIERVIGVALLSPRVERGLIRRSDRQFLLPAAN